MNKLFIGTIVALGLASTSAMAQSTWSGGHSRADRHGASAGGGSGSEYRQDRMRRDRGGDRSAERAERAPSNSASTYGSGSIYTDRRRASGAVAAGGRASGSGPQAASSAIDAYGATDRNGSSAEVYGDSSATSGE